MHAAPRSLLVVALLAAAILPVGFAPRAAHACSCAWEPGSYRIDSAEVAFMGTVDEFEFDPATGRSRAVFDVLLVQKGDAPARVTVRDDAGGSCTALGPTEAVVQVYARVIDGELFTHMCDGTHSINPSQVPLPPDVGSGRATDDSASGMLVAGAALVLGSAAVLAACRRGGG